MNRMKISYLFYQHYLQNVASFHVKHIGKQRISEVKLVQANCFVQQR